MSEVPLYRRCHRAPSARSSHTRERVSLPIAPHGGLRPFHQKLTCLHEINCRALCGSNVATYPADFSMGWACKVLPGSFLKFIDFCITRLKAQGPS